MKPPPQTQGKVERFHQTMKKFLEKQEPATSKKQLQRELDNFVRYYNTVRLHRSLKRKTPAEVFAAPGEGSPRAPIVDATGYRVRHDKVDKVGQVTLRYRGNLHHIGVGRPYAGWRVILLVAGREVRIIRLDGSPLRHVILDPTKDYQPMP